MSKNKRIKLEFEGTSYVLGIASNERIWKLCWDVNKALGLQLSNEREEIPGKMPQTLYADPQTDTYFEYQFIENTGKITKVPKIAQQFRFWLVIKPRREKAPDLEKMISALKGCESISMVMDLSPFNQEKQFLS